MTTTDKPDFSIAEKLSGMGYLFTTHELGWGGAKGHGKTTPGLTLEKVKKTFTPAYPVIGLKGGVEIRPGCWSIILDADAPGVYDKLMAADKRLTECLSWYGSKPGHFVGWTDKPIPKMLYDTKDGERAIDILGVGATAGMPPGLAKRTGKPYILIRDGEPFFIPADELLAILDRLAKENNWEQKEEEKQTTLGPPKEKDEIINQIRQMSRPSDVGLSNGRQDCYIHTHETPKDTLYVSIRPDGSWGWYCHSRKIGGDVLDVLTTRDGKTLPDAIDIMKKKLGLTNALIKRTPSVIATPVTTDAAPEHVNDETKPMIKMAYNIQHTPFGDDLEKIMQLEGDAYRLAIKAVAYHLLGRWFMASLDYGGLHDDTRCNPLFVMPSGSGKLNIMTTIQLGAGAFGMEIVRPVSYHPEQFIGKMEPKPHKKHEEVEWQEIEGHFRRQFIQMDELWAMMAGKEQHSEDTWKYVSLALDPYGRNRVEKKVVAGAIPLSYLPACTLSAAMQPRRLGEDVILQGLFRRFMVAYIQPEKGDEKKMFTDRLKRGLSDVDATKNIAAYSFGKSQNPVVAPKFPERLHEKLTLYQLEILSYLRARGEKSSKLSEILRFQIQNTIVKMAAIQALYRISVYNQQNPNSKVPDEINEDDLQEAFIDAFEFADSGARFVESCVAGSLDYGADWNGATNQFQELLKFLQMRGCFSKEDAKRENMTIENFGKEICTAFGLQEGSRQWRRKLAMMRANNWIKATQVGKTDSCVWLAFNPRSLPIPIWNDENSEYIRLTNRVKTL